MPLPPYIEPENAIKVCHYAVTPLSNSVPLNASFKTNLPPRVKSLSYSILKQKVADQSYQTVYAVEDGSGMSWYLVSFV